VGHPKSYGYNLPGTAWKYSGQGCRRARKEYNTQNGILLRRPENPADIILDEASEDFSMELKYVRVVSVIGISHLSHGEIV